MGKIKELLHGVQDVTQDTLTIASVAAVFEGTKSATLTLTTLGVATVATLLRRRTAYYNGVEVGKRAERRRASYTPDAPKVIDGQVIKETISGQ